jgi:hypothetical protein
VNPYAVCNASLRRRYGRSQAKDHGQPYTLEEENHLLGSRHHRKATKYETLESAVEYAKVKAARSQPFMTHNVLDRAGYVVATFKGGS